MISDALQGAVIVLQLLSIGFFVRLEHRLTKLETKMELLYPSQK